MIIKAWEAPPSRSAVGAGPWGPSGRDAPVGPAPARESLGAATAALIDARFGGSLNWACVHGLRLEGRAGAFAIDHMLVGRCLDFWLFRSNRYASGVKVTEEGDFLAWDETGRRYVGEASPLMEMDAVARALGWFLADAEIMPRRLGVRMPPTIRSFVLTNPAERLIRPERFDASRVVKADRFHEPVEANAGKTVHLGALDLARAVSSDTLRSLAWALVRSHRPAREAKGGSTPTGNRPSARPTAATPVGLAGRATSPSGAVCPKCDDPRISVKHGRFGYFWACAGCGKASSIEVPRGARVRKSGRTFHVVSQDGSERLLHVNDGD